MTATYDEAWREILSVFKAAWDPTGYEAVYENVADPQVPNTVAPWARVGLRTVTGGQDTLADGSGGQRWNRTGVLTVQVFVPTGEGLSRGYDLAKIISDAYEGVSTASQVWFRDVRVNEIGADGSWFQLNVLVNFTYDEVK